MTRLNVIARKKVFERIRMSPPEGNCFIKREKSSHEVSQER